MGLFYIDNNSLFSKNSQITIKCDAESNWSTFYDFIRSKVEEETGQQRQRALINLSSREL